MSSRAIAQDATPDQAELIALVRAQAEEIAKLRSRLDRIEGAAAAAGQRASAPPARLEIGANRQPLANDESIADLRCPQIVAPDLADQGVAEVIAAAKNAAGVTTEWKGGLPTFRSPDGFYMFKMRGRIISHASTTFGSKYDTRNITTTGMRALRIGLEGGAGPHFFYQFENDFADNVSDVGTAFVGWRDTVGDVSYDVRFGNMFNDRSFEGSSGSDAPPFLERNVVATSIIPQRGFYGISIMPRIFWKSGHASITLSGDSMDARQSTSDSRTLMARAHWNPIKTDRSVLHSAFGALTKTWPRAASRLPATR